MGTVFVGIIVILAILLAIQSVKKRAISGCCSTGDASTVKRTKVEDKNLAHYPYEAVAQIDGMMCEGCAVKVENALNSLPGVYARVDLPHKSADIHMKEKQPEENLRHAVNDLGAYTVMSLQWK